MGRTIHKVGVIAFAYFSVYDSSDAAVTGLVDGDFTKRLARDGVDNPEALTILVTEIANGRYYATFTPSANGQHYLTISHATHNPRGWDETFSVTLDGVPTIALIQSGLATAAALATVQADTDNLQTRLPAALVGGRMDSSVGAMAAGAITAAAIATGAIDADALAADAVTEIAAGISVPSANANADAQCPLPQKFTRR